MRTPQGGIFALGTASHAYLEFDAVPDHGADLVQAIAALREPRTTMGGVNLVVGFRPRLWAEVVPEDAPADVTDFERDLVGPDGFVMPATQHDAVLWLSGSAYDVVFECARNAIAELSGLATVVEETSSWPYMHDRDLTGFIDGTENPTLIDAPGLALIPDTEPGGAGTVLLAAEVGARRGDVGGALGDRAGGGDRPAEAGQHRDRGQARGLARREHRPGPVRQDLPPQHAVRHRHEPRHHVRRLQRRPEAALRHARGHGRARRRAARRADPLHASADRRLLLRAGGGLAAPVHSRRGRRGHSQVAGSIARSRRARRKSTIRTWIAPATGIAASAPRTPASSAPTSTETRIASGERETVRL